MDRKALKGARARLRGLATITITTFKQRMQRSAADDYIAILKELADAIGKSLEQFNLPNGACGKDMNGAPYVDKDELSSKIGQLEHYIDAIYVPDDKILEIGSIFNAIQDGELKARCSDLLSARDKFDRVVNQATQVLEDRIRKKVGDNSGSTGVQLANKHIKVNPIESPIVFSDVPAEQDGWANLYRGVMGAFRNSSHHRFNENMTREQALQIAAFIDNLLANLGLGMLNPNGK